mgnify:CR=1 FL=1
MKLQQSEDVFTKKSERIEKKFILSRGQGIIAEHALIRFGFRKIFTKRIINSIYFDDLNYSSLRDNINGNPYRDKIRVRYYDNNFKNAYLEIKHKRNVLGYKTVYKIEPCVSESQIIKIASVWIKEKLNNIYFPVSLVKYNRNYYRKHNIRATLDQNVCGFRYVSQTTYIKSNFSGYEVVELKYKKEDDDYARQIYSDIEKFSSRATKSSKYSNSLMY